MGFSQDKAQEYIDELEELADSIEKRTQRMYFTTGTTNPRKVLGETGTRNIIWRQPDDEILQLQKGIRRDYEVWYAKGEELVHEYLTQRFEEFEKEYDEIKKYLSLDDRVASPNAFNCFVDHFMTQQSIVSAVPAKIEVRKLKVRRWLSKRIEKGEIQRARELFEKDFVRASGVIASVSLERHLITMCENSEKVSDFERNHGISRLAQTLYESDVIDKTTWHDLKALASIRGTCAHPEEPKKEAVRRLINEAEEFIRTHEV